MSEQSPTGRSDTARAAIQTLLLCDLVASTQLVERLGDVAAADLLGQHDRLARNLLSTFNGREIDKSDGFLLLFERPVEALRFAVAYQSGIQAIGTPFGATLITRVGIHLGEVVTRENSPADIARGAKPLEVEGLAKALAARVMSLAGNGRILLTRTAFDFARRAVVGDKDADTWRWAAHGRYQLTGIEEPVEICEVTVNERYDLSSPADSEKAHRLVLSDHPPDTLPATKQPVSDATMTIEPLLAVLAFDNLSNDPDMQFFSDGVSDEIIQRLSNGANLKVIGRTSSFQFRGDRKAEAAHALNCSHLLDGSIRRAAGRVRISAHLVDAVSQTTLWSDRYDRVLEDIFAVQDEISEQIAHELRQAFSPKASQSVDPEAYDLYLRSLPNNFSPAEMRINIGLLEVATARSPKFAPAWGRLAHLRSFLGLYAPYEERAAISAAVGLEATQALALDPDNCAAMIGQAMALPPYGRFLELHAILTRAQQSRGHRDGRQYIGYFLRTTGRMRDSLEECERLYQLNALDPMTANTVALARMAAGRVAEAIPVYEALVERIPDMSFPVSSLLRAYAFAQDWAAVDRLLVLAEKRQLREFQDGLPFIRTKRDPSPANIASWKNVIQVQVDNTGGIDLSRLVYASHLGLVDEAYQWAATARLGPNGTSHDIMGPDAYRTSLLFQACMPELRNDLRFPNLCARLGLVEFWATTGKWPDCADETPYDFRAACLQVRHLPIDLFGY